MTWQESGKKGTWARCGHSQCQGMDVSYQLSCRTSWWAGYRWCDMAVRGGIGSLESWAFRKAAVQYKNVMRNCAASPHGLGAGHSSGHPVCQRRGACRDCHSFPRMCGGLWLHNKMPPTSLGIISISSQSVTKLQGSPASPGYCLESFSSEGSEQMKFISMVTCKSYPRIQIFYFFFFNITNCYIEFLTWCLSGLGQHPCPSEGMRADTTPHPLACECSTVINLGTLFIQPFSLGS